MYDMVKQMIKDKYGSINKLSKVIGVEAGDLYAGFKGTKVLYPKYMQLIADALGEDVAHIFNTEVTVEVCPCCGRIIRKER